MYKITPRGMFRKAKKNNREEYYIQSGLISAIELILKKYPELEYLYAVPNGMRTSMAVAVKAKREGLKAGVPDLFLPVARLGFYGLYLETKTKKGCLSPSQKKYKNFLELQGYKYVVYRDIETGLKILKNYLNEIDESEEEK
jgi:hypothetical protein